MYEESESKKALTGIRKNWNLIPTKKDKIEFNNFGLLRKGDAFRIVSVWQCPEISLNTYLVKYSNSYRLNIVKGEKEYKPKLNASTYFGCYILFDHNFPDFIIRPNTFADRLVNIFFRDQIKIKSTHGFNNKYIVESNKKDSIEKTLGKELFDLVLSAKKISIETCQNKCFIFSPEPAWVNNDYDNMLQIAKLLSQRDLLTIR